MSTHLFKGKHLLSHFNYQTLTASHIETNNAEAGRTGTTLGVPLAACDNFGVCFILLVGLHYNPQHS